MKQIHQLISDLETNSIDETGFYNALVKAISDGNIKQKELVDELATLKKSNKISETIHDKVIHLLNESNAETVIETNKNEPAVTEISPTLDTDDAKTIIADPANAETVVASPVATSQAENSNQSDVTQLASDVTQIATNITSVDQQNNETELDHSADTDKTRIATDPNATEVAKSDSAVTSVATTDLQFNRAETSTNTVIANQQTVQELTQQNAATVQIGIPKKLAPGSIIKDRFILKNVIGAGGMSVVFRALDLRKQEAKNHNPYVAIKVLGDSFKHHPLSLLALERETQKIQSLAHPNIITVYDFDRDGDNIYMTMECLEGRSLDAVIRENKNGMSFNDARAIIDGMSQALDYAHSKDIIHSDFKPENVYYTDRKITKVLDFGIARAKKLPGAKPVDTVFDAGDLSALTPPYASLEMIKDQDPDPRDDIYALACVTYKLLSGKHPYNNLQADIAQKAEMKPTKINSLNRRQWQTLLAGLAFERKDRIKTVEEFIDGIMPKKRGWVYALAAAVVLAIGTSGYLGTSITEQNAIPKIKLSQDQKNKIQNYIEIAELYYSLGYLATPPGDSALDQYAKILEIDPSNKTAIEGKKKLVKRYQELSNEKLKGNDFEESLLLLETALLIDPDNEDLLDSQNKVKDLRSEFN